MKAGLDLANAVKGLKGCKYKYDKNRDTKLRSPLSSVSAIKSSIPGSAEHKEENVLHAMTTVSSLLPSFCGEHKSLDTKTSRIFGTTSVDKCKAPTDAYRNTKHAILFFSVSGLGSSYGYGSK
ncbi:hypothetical protein PpBr36_08512 [Pyricularia pennisetigena]|uniref:hypothetical protein n=1 Tax=Pyricularia pennisetigena TaxID=1578925 RepID=UPI001154F724|nr:hypothetical protein PpBr36_08512 [Pyricularia pennisetigena]TLS24088.1 hypothetical protein PpBr36_08512 [Pyricularia pennisetigena]